MTLDELVKNNDPVSQNFNNDLAVVINRAMPYIYTIAGLMLLVWLIWGGIILMTSSGDGGKMAQGYGKIKDALIGFLIIFLSYFLVQIVEVVLGVKIF